MMSAMPLRRTALITQSGVVGTLSGDFCLWACEPKISTYLFATFFAVLTLSRFRASYVAAVECIPGGCRPLTWFPLFFGAERKQGDLFATEMMSAYPFDLLLCSSDRKGVGSESGEIFRWAPLAKTTTCLFATFLQC
jgi:hypothetical protein